MLPIYNASTFQVCANHYITTDMQLQPKPESEKSLIWVAADFADGGSEPVIEKFAIRFKTAEITLAFKEKVDECKVSPATCVFIINAVFTAFIIFINDLPRTTNLFVELFADSIFLCTYVMLFIRK